jgi:hypothetical protein
MFFSFNQNNSGGSFIGPHVVIVEAETADEANEIAVAKAGVYFDGAGDCECCGRRWSETWDDGADVPSNYGDPVEASEFVQIIYADGRIEGGK